MKNDFHTCFSNFPILPNSIIEEANNSNYKKCEHPYSFSAVAMAIRDTVFYKNLSSVFGDISADYIKNEPNSLYDWHTDFNRSCSVNWVIKTSPSAFTFFRSNRREPFFWDLEQVKYDLYKPTVLDTTKNHCIINNHHKERIIMSISIYKKKAYNDVVDYFKNLSIDSY